MTSCITYDIISSSKGVRFPYPEDTVQWSMQKAYSMISEANSNVTAYNSNTPCQ